MGQGESCVWPHRLGGEWGEETHIFHRTGSSPDSLKQHHEHWKDLWLLSFPDCVPEANVIIDMESNYKKASGVNDKLYIILKTKCSK